MSSSPTPVTNENTPIECRETSRLFEELKSLLETSPNPRKPWSSSFNISMSRNWRKKVENSSGVLNPPTSSGNKQVIKDLIESIGTITVDPLCTFSPNEQSNRQIRATQLAGPNKNDGQPFSDLDCLANGRRRIGQVQVASIALLYAKTKEKNIKKHKKT